MVYGLGVVATSLRYLLWRWRLARPRIFSKSPPLRLGLSSYSQVEEAGGTSVRG